MKTLVRFIVGLGVLVILIPGAYLFTSDLMESVYQYRSPLKDAPPAAGEPLGTTLTHRLVFILVDALREDTSLNAAVMPELNRLRQLGAWATMHSRPPSYSEAAYSVLLTGAWPDLSDGPAFNLDYADIPTFTQEDLFSTANRVGLESGISANYWFEKLVPQPAVSYSFYTPLEDQTADRQVVDAALPWLKAGEAQLVFIHLDQVDYAGHYEGGARDALWNAAAQRADALIAEIIATLDLNRDTLFICSDHGQIDQGGHGGPEEVVLVEPFVLVGAGVKPGHYEDVQMVDVAPTLATLLGTSLPASSQGRPLTHMLALSEEQNRKVQSALQEQQNRLARAYFSAIDMSAPVAEGGEVVSAVHRAMEKARDQRLAKERLPRFLLAIVLLVLPGVAVIWYRRSRKMPFYPLVWVPVGALVYVIVFHLIFAVLGGNPYSFSMVASQEKLLMTILGTTLIAFVPAWLLFILVRKTVTQAPRLAVEGTLGFVYGLLYCCALPVLWFYALYGVSFTWTLP